MQWLSQLKSDFGMSVISWYQIKVDTRLRLELNILQDCSDFFPSMVLAQVGMRYPRKVSIQTKASHTERNAEKSALSDRDCLIYERFSSVMRSINSSSTQTMLESVFLQPLYLQVTILCDLKRN